MRSMLSGPRTLVGRPAPPFTESRMPAAATVPESLFARLEPLLPTVQKPIQYVGGELNSTVKDWDCARPRSAGR